AAGRTLETRSLDGERVLLIGPPNAGKSSLLNALVGEERALVHPSPGTTRDLVSAPLRLFGRRLTLLDSAGIRAAEGVEALGVRRALALAQEAELVVWVEDIACSPEAPPVTPGLCVLAKADLPPHPLRVLAPSSSAARVSARTGDGLEALRARLAGLTEARTGAASGRQRSLLLAAAEQLDAPPELEEALLSARLERGVEILGRLVGRGDGAMVAAEAVFSRFCIGK
ncbi:MAG: GTPase, partial [Deltaproteobacteria bacterium]